MIFPAHYGPLLQHVPGTKVMVVLLASRNACVIVLFLVALAASATTLWRPTAKARAVHEDAAEADIDLA